MHDNPLIKLHLKTTTNPEVNELLQQLPTKTFILDFNNKRLCFQICRDNFTNFEFDETSSMLSFNKLHYRRRGIRGIGLLDFKYPKDSKKVEEFVYGMLNENKVCFGYDVDSGVCKMMADEERLEFQVVM